MKILLTLVCGLILIGQSQTLQASETEIDVHGYLSRGYMKSSKYNYLADNSKDGTTKWGEIGINFGYQAHDRLRIGFQVLARELGNAGNYEPHLDWGFLDYQLNEYAAIKYGKFFTPWGFYNEGRDVDILRNSILLPQSIYKEDYRDISLMKGLELHGEIPIGENNSIEYRLAKGNMDFDKGATFLLDIKNDLGNPASVDMNINGFTSYGLVWNTWIEGLRLGLTSTEYDVDINATARPYILFDNTRNWEVASLEYTQNQWTYSFERLTAHFDQVFLGQTRPHWDIQSDYHQIIYRYNEKYEFGVVKTSEHNKTFENKSLIDQYLDDLGFTVRIDLTEDWTLKLEYHDMKGTNPLRALLNPTLPTPTNNLGENWDMFMAKVTYKF